MEKERKQRPPLGERLLKGLQEVNEWARGERDDLRVTVATLPADAAVPPATAQPTKTPRTAKR